MVGFAPIGIVPAPFSCHHPRMNQCELEGLLHSCISYALKQAKFNRPKAHDATERDAYYHGTADKVMEQLKLSGWTLEPPQVMRKGQPNKYGDPAS